MAVLAFLPALKDGVSREVPDDRIRRDLMGHGLKRERYGKGSDMEHVHGLLLPLAL